MNNYEIKINNLQKVINIGTTIDMFKDFTFDLREYQEDVVDKALKIGFDKVGFAPVLLETEGAHLKSWLAKEFHGDMSWM